MALIDEKDPLPDPDSREWLRALRSSGGERERAVGRLHALLLRAARFEVSRRAYSMAPHERDDLANQSADDALVAVLAKLDGYRGASRFTTWAYKFALLEAGVKTRRRAWEGREVTLADDRWALLADRASTPHEDVEASELLRALGAAIESELTPRQREVFVALALNEVPIDVLAERLDTNRGALYKTLHDARRKLRARLLPEGGEGALIA